MKKIRVLLIAALLLICTASMTLPVSAGTGIKVNDDMTVEMYDWSATWDANQNNAYIDIVNGIFDMQTEISLRDDYITSLQLMNVAKRISIDHSEWEGVDFESASYTNDGYVDKVTITYTPFHSKETIRELADYTAFGKSLLDETMTDLEKALVLHDYISQRTYYANPESDIGSGASIFLKHRGICANFAVAYCELLYSAGVPLGFATGSTGETAHAWANIYIDGKWYASDTTFDAPTDPKDINYTMPQHEYFLRGTENHVDQFLLSIYNASDNIYGYEIENIEAKDPTAYWDFSDCGSNVAYHMNEGEAHGKWYYLSGIYGGPSTKNPLTVRDSLMADAAVTSHPERVYANIAWDGNNLYGFRDDSIYIIDWNTFEETKIAYLENDVLYTLNGGSFEVAQEFYNETSGLTGILAKNGQLTAQITFVDGSAKEYTAYTYDKVVSTPSEGAGKVTVSGPTREPGPILYGFSLFQQDIMNTAASIDGFFGTGTHSDGLQVDELVCDLKITSIGNNAFTDLGADKFSGPLVLNKFILKIGAHAFENCTGITGTVDLSTVNYLEPYAFSGCTGIEKVILCPGRTMEDHVFMGCTGMTEAENLDTYNSIGASAFEGCTALSNCIDFYETGAVWDKAFKDCVNITTTPVIKLGTIRDYAFENCVNMKGPISLPNVGWVGKQPFKNTGITRLLDTDEAWHIVGSLLYDTQIKGILNFPNLSDFREYTFHDADGLDAIRFPNPETKEVNDNPYSLPETTDVALFVVKNSPMEDLIKDRWTYGVNYWYVDDVIAQGELDNGVVWSISGDGTMTFDLADGVSETVTVSGYSDTTAPWDEYKKYVEKLNVDNNKIIFGSDAICGFANLRSVSFVKGSSYDENAFAECELLSQENIDTERCIHDFGEWVRTKEPNCSNTGTEERSCSKCGEIETRVIAPLGHDWGEQRIDVEPTEELLGWYIRDCQRCDVHEWTQIPMLVHGEKVTKVEAADATCTTNGCIEHWRCDNCGRLYSDENLEHEITNQGSVVIKALGHDYKEVEGSAVAVTCEIAGKKADQKCSRCNDVKQGAEIEALGHNWGGWTVVKEATETEEGLKRRVCSRDPSHVDDLEIPKLEPGQSSDHVDGLKNDWREDWDANQNNAYIDLINGLYEMDDEISLRDDYITSEQFFNVLQRVVQEHTYWELVVIERLTYTEDGYVDTVKLLYQPQDQSIDPAETKTVMHQMADAVAFGKSYIDDTMTDYEKALFCHDFISQRTIYKEPEMNKFGFTEGVFLQHQGTCMNISRSYQALLNYAQVPYADVGGYQHAWTAICVDNKWYVSDATFDTGGDEDYDISKYYKLSHQFLLCGINRHYEDKIECIYRGYDIVDQLEYDDSREYWTLKDYNGTLAYHVNEGESHGLIYYLETNPANNASILTTRDSLRNDANIVHHYGNEYSALAWGNDTLFGIRDNAVYIIDWNTYSETLIARIEGSEFRTYDADGTCTSQEALKNDEGNLSGIIAENGGLYVKVDYPDLSWEQFQALSYEPVVFELSSVSDKVALNGPSAEPGEVLYNCRNRSFANLGLTIERPTDKFSHPDGYTPKDNVHGFPVVGIWEEAFKNLGPDRLGGRLKLPGCLGDIRERAFENCTGLRGNLDLSKVYSVGNYAFKDCSGLDGKVILYPEPRGVFDYVFAGCSGIKEVIGLEGNTYIGNSAFRGCTSLTGPYDLSELQHIFYDAFNGCTRIEIEPSLKSINMLWEGVFKDCESISGTISIPNCNTIESYALTGTNVTRVKDTDKLETINGKGYQVFNGKLTGIMSFPSLTYLSNIAFKAENNLTALRFPNPNTIIVDNTIDAFPESNDVALFVVKDSALENIIKEKWTYGVNYWYVDDVIAEGVLDNAVSWEILGDGSMNFTAAGQRGAKGPADQIVISIPEGEDAPWEEYKKYVETINVNSENLCIGTKSISGFANLEKVELTEGATCQEGAFENCENLSEDNVETIDKCAHEFGEWTNTVEATCTEPGTKERTCSLCGKTETEEVKALGHEWKTIYTIDEQATCTEPGQRSIHCSVCNELKPDSTLVIPPLGHNVQFTPAVEPTCTETGLTEGRKCSVCGEVIVPQEEVPATGHDWGEWTVFKEATCTEAGTETRVCKHDINHVETRNIDAKGHTEVVIPAVEPTCTETGLSEGKKCSVCNEILVVQEEVPALGHNYEEVEGTAVAATCETDGKEADKKCSRCDSTITGETIEALGHDWGEWEVVKEATEDEEGLKIRTCTRDPSHTEESTIPKLTHVHNLVRTAPAAATCTEAGNIEYWTCSKCHKIYSDANAENEISEAETVVKAKGHDWDTEYTIDEQPSCTLEGYKSIRCKVCHVVKEGSVTEIPALGHDYKAVLDTAVAATCETAGKEADQKCTRCDSTITGNVIEALGHDWGDWVVVKEATEDEEGLKIRTCTRDPSHTEQSTIPKLTHVHDLVRTAPVAATCTEAGNIEYWTCSKCHKLYSDKNAENEITEAETIIKAKGHTEEDIPAVAATCTEKGKTAGKKCSVCGEILLAQEETAALGHNYQTVSGTAVAATCETAGKEADQKCSRCDSTIEGATIPALGHDWGEWTVTKAATCTEDGEEQRVCSRDESHVEKRTIEAKGHTEVDLPAVAATCTEKGKTAGKKCSVCGEILVAQEEVPALGHDYKTVEGSAVAATCETAGKEADKKCSRCDSTITGKTIEALGHNWGEWTVIKEATEEEEGLERRVCSRDDSHVEERIIPKLNHVHDLVRTAPTEATCTEAGNIEYWTCSKCGRFYSDANAEHEIEAADTVVKAKGHNEVVLEAKAATCTETGLTAGKKCSVCNEILVTQEEIPALGHDYKTVEGTAVAATCETAGKEADKKCSRCDSTIEGKAIAALGHDYKTIEGSAVAATCEKAGKEADQKCSRCDSTIEGKAIAALGHDYKTVEGSAVAATCTDAGKEADQRCSRCDSLIVGLTIEALGHDWDEWVVVKEATEDEEGLEQRVCRRDSSHVEERVITKLSHVHKPEKVSAIKATCDKDGNIEYWTCSKCGKFFADSNATLEITEEETLIKATGHDWTDGRITKEPAAGKEGEMTYTCSICGQTYGEPIPALAEEQAEAYEAVDAAEEATDQAQQKAESIDASSSEQDLADADKLVSDTAEEASAAVEAAEAAAQKAAAEYGEGSEAVVFAKAKVVQARQTKAKAMAAAAAVKAVAAEAAVQKADTAQSSAAAAAVKPGEEAVKAAQEAEVAAKDYLEKATAAKETADAALEAVVEAGYTEDSEEYKSAAKAVTAAETAKASAETRLAEATAAVTAAEEAKTKEETKEIVDLPKVTISKVVAGKKSATVKWKKLSKKSQNKIYKIQIQYSTDKKFKKYVKTTTAKKTAVSKKISKLKKGKRYYFRIRSYKKTGGRVHVSKWSTVKNTKAK